MTRFTIKANGKAIDAVEADGTVVEHIADCATDNWAFLLAESFNRTRRLRSMLSELVEAADDIAEWRGRLRRAIDAAKSGDTQ